MKSPFPGMDPFIEGSPDWGDFHGHLIEAIYAQLADSAPEGYFVRTSIREYLEMVEQEGKQSHPFVPDVSVESRQPRRKTAKGPRKGTLVAVRPESDPVTLRAFITEAHRERFVEVYKADADEPRLVTAIEILSPANKKPGSHGRRDYLRKRESLMLGDVHLIEIDLLRRGDRMPMVDPWPASPYVLMVARVGCDHLCSVYQGHSDRPLPSLPVPLLEPDPDLRIDLQPMVDAIYRRSRYSQSLKYDRPILPPLGDAEQALLVSRLKRSRT